MVLGGDIVIFASGNMARTGYAFDMITVDVGDCETIFTNGSLDAKGVFDKATTARFHIGLDINTVVSLALASTGNAAKSSARAASGRPLLRDLGSTAVGEVAAFAIADGVGEGADALGRVLFIIRNKAVFAGKVTWPVPVTDGFTVIGVMALLLIRLGIDEIPEEVLTTRLA
jgi:hypothetical protein